MINNYINNMNNDNDVDNDDNDDDNDDDDDNGDNNDDCKTKIGTMTTWPGICRSLLVLDLLLVFLLFAILTQLHTAEKNS